MVQFEIIDVSVVIIKDSYRLANIIRESDKVNGELRQAVMHQANELNIVCTILEHLRTFAHRVTVADEAFIIANINSITPIIENTRKTLQDVDRDRNLFGRLLMKDDEHRQSFREISSHLHELCALLQRSVSAVTKTVVPDHL
ncbi:unnamed protein product [Rotaria socialis]|uniref:Uncharacterized protein n=1 Tax=Rotaria socialis TaxID=392032 RepID=A0A819VYS4_9BILA|nr:unnamed protein product [Rotaria socialis]CAF3760220.1 unnamed protein product [Rotaria socialis]CAF4115482.1 unnamed protein product [Rotaria socialis]CAF4771754.1 unnamed protein product [Rotaria socialis]